MSIKPLRKKLLILLICGLTFLSACRLPALPERTDTETETTEPTPAATFPLSSPPIFPAISLPEEDYEDETERLAAEIIDPAIEQALSALSALKDPRHSAVAFPFEQDADGSFAQLSDGQKELYRTFLAAGQNWETFRISQKEYGERLITDVLTLSPVLFLQEPLLGSYFSPDVFSEFDAVSDGYFDPRRDENASVRKGRATLEQIRGDALLLQRVIRRIVRYMPDGLSAYDRYYYLAAVICARNVYDEAPANSTTPFGALIGGKSVCEGYTTAFYLLCREADLWCTYRHGLVDGVAHVWNMIKLESGIYNVDVTWCDGCALNDPAWYDNFVRSEADFASDGHNASQGPAATGEHEPNPYQK